MIQTGRVISPLRTAPIFDIRIFALQTLLLPNFLLWVFAKGGIEVPAGTAGRASQPAPPSV